MLTTHHDSVVQEFQEHNYKHVFSLRVASLRHKLFSGLIAVKLVVIQEWAFLFSYVASLPMISPIVIE